MEQRKSHIVPADVVKRVTQAGGLNLYGKPNYRIVWGEDRLTIFKHVVGSTRIVDHIPKYLPPYDRWIVERWFPPEFYGGTVKWKQTTSYNDEETGLYIEESLGPYPSEGEYEHCWTLRDPDTGGFLDITPEVAEYIVRAIVASRERYTDAERWVALKQKKEKQAAALDKREDDVIDDAMPAFHGCSNITVPDLPDGFVKRGDLWVKQ